MTDHTCARCKRPIHDTAYVCTICAAQLRRHLELTAKLAGEHETTIAKLDRIRHTGAGTPDIDGWERHEKALEAIPLPYRPEVAARYRAAKGELTTWARHIGLARTGDPRSGSGRGAGPVFELRFASFILVTNIDWLRYRQESEEAWPTLLAACTQLKLIIDSRPDGHIVGACDCARWLYAETKDQDVVRCWSCGASWDVGTSRAKLVDAARAKHVSAAEAADLIAGWVDPGTDRTNVRKLIHKWAGNGLIDVDGNGRYELGPILDRWTRALAARVA